jgi:hypothetical protein
VIEPVRNMRSNMTHLTDVESTTAGVSFGVVYRKPPTDTKAFCGVAIRDGVVMQPGTKVKCRACLHVARFYEKKASR